MTPSELSAIRALHAKGYGIFGDDLRALLDEVERIRAERDDLFAWSQRFSDLVGVDGSTKAGRDEAFAKLYDAAKASGKLVKE
jgi:hypothetical protein